MARFLSVLIFEQKKVQTIFGTLEPSQAVRCITISMMHPAHDGEKPEGASDKQGDTDPCIIPSQPHSHGLTNGEVLQLRMLNRGIKVRVETGMNLTRPAFVHNCWLYWMERAGVNLEGKRPNWVTKGRLLEKHWGFALKDSSI